MRGFRLQGRQDSNLQPPVLEVWAALPIRSNPVFLGQFGSSQVD
jgi:hypothetical protein